MLLLDTHVLVWLAEGNPRLGAKALQTINKALATGQLGVASISFWEIAMLIHSGRLRDDISPVQYMADLCLVLSLTVLPITPEIASLSQGNFFHHKDPADRIIAATAIHHNAPLITADKKLKKLEPLTVIW